jgi:hypothetical protein
MEESIGFAVLMIVGSALPILYFNHKNGDSLRIERFYYKKNIVLYKTLQFCLFLLMVNIAINIRVIVMDAITFAKDYMEARLA